MNNLWRRVNISSDPTHPAYMWEFPLFARIQEWTRGWRTVIWNAFIAIIPSLLYVVDRLGSTDLSPWLSQGGTALAGIVIGLTGIWLRMITTGPVGSKGEEAPTPETKAGD